MAKRRKGKHERRKPNTGYTTQAKNGTWTAYFPRFGGGYHVKRGFDTRETAEAWCDSLLKQRSDKQDVGSGLQKTATWIDAWAQRSAREREWKAKMIADVEFKVGYAKPYIGEMVLLDVLPDHIDAMLDDLSKDLTENTIRQIRNYLWQIFEAARLRRYITFNPVLKPQRRKRAKQKEPVRLTAPQTATLLIAAEPSFYGLALWLIACIGLRSGEACGLRRGDIDFDACTLNIAQEVTDLRGRPHKDTPKNDKQRAVPFPRALAPTLHLHLRALTTRAAKGTARGTWQEHGLVFPGKSGKPMNPTSLRHVLKDYTDATALPPITTHMLRHTAGQLLTRAGCPENVIAAILGHAPGTITRHYAPPDIETMRPWVEKVYQMIAGEVERVRRTG